MPCASDCSTSCSTRVCEFHSLLLIHRPKAHCGGSMTGLRGLSSADYNQYLDRLKKRVESVWKFPEGVSGVQKVSILFTLDRAGRLVQSEVLDSTDTRMNASAVEAMKRASPFAPIPESLKDLANTPLRMQFTVTVGVRG